MIAQEPMPSFKDRLATIENQKRPLEVVLQTADEALDLSVAGPKKPSQTEALSSGQIEE